MEIEDTLPLILVLYTPYASELQTLITQYYKKGYVLSDKPVSSSKGFTVLMELPVPTSTRPLQ